MNSREIKELIKAWFFISLAFAILFYGGFKIFSDFSAEFIVLFFISALTVGVAFLLHELAHKFVAQKYGYKAEFQAFDRMLFLAVVMSFFGFILAAPGAVMIKAENIPKEKNGKISIAGTLTNLFLALLFFTPLLLFGFSGFLFTLFKYGFIINSLLAVFNLIPFPGFDGRKVFDWNKFVWISTSIIAAALLMISLSFL